MVPIHLCFLTRNETYLFPFFYLSHLYWTLYLVMAAISAMLTQVRIHLQTVDFLTVGGHNRNARGLTPARLLMSGGGGGCSGWQSV